MDQLELDFKPRRLEGFDEAGIYRQLCGHVGRDNAVPVPELASRVVMSVRELQTVIRKMRVKGVPIGVNHRKPNGYFLCESAEEYDAMRKMFHGQGLSLLKVAAGAFSPKNEGYRQLVGQLDIFPETT